MSQPKRWGLCWTAKVEDPEQGAWVEYDDYAALAAENERLRKAGDFTFRTIDQHITVEEYEWIAEIETAWNAAKEGRDAK